jgi:eukaryotic-like serine/threonine-protein kinase
MSDLDVNREIAGRYRVVRLIGRGGMGAVYEVEHLHTGQRLAMKVLTANHHNAAVERFKRETRAASRIQSDHIVRVTDADVAPELGGSPFLVMELLDGMDLEHAVAGGPATPETVVGWLRQVARGLGKAHDAGIIHRDLKPENLFLTQREDGSALVKILDFGIAKLTEDGGTLTQSDQFLGTPAYMAPEQADNREGPVTAAADLYALGLIAFRLLVGRTYWRPGSLAQLLAQVLTEKMVPASQRGSTLGPAFDAWLLRACDRDAALRFASATEQIEALAGALGLPQVSLPMTPPATPKAAMSTLEGVPTLGASSRELTTVRSRRRRAQLVGSAATVLAVLGGAFMLMRSPGADRSTSVPGVASVVPSITASAAAPIDPPVASTATLPAAGVDAATPAAPVTTTAPPAPVPSSSKKRPVPPGHLDAGRNPLDGQY